MIEFNALRFTNGKSGRKSYSWAVILLDSSGNKIAEPGYHKFSRISKKEYDEFISSGRFKQNKYLKNQHDDSGLGKLSDAKQKQFVRLPVHPRLRTPITYYGGKQSLLKHIFPLIPVHRLYCEPFFGGGAVFFAKPASDVEVINDLNGEAVNFYRVVQTQFLVLEREVKATLHSRQLYKTAMGIYEDPEKHSDVKRAWAFWTLTNQGFASMIGSWGFDNINSKTRTITNKREHFTKVFSERLKGTQIESNDAVRVINRCDSTDAFFYCDPPYINTAQGHYKGYAEADFELLLKCLSQIKGKFLLSSYPSPMLSRYIKKQGWKIKRITKAIAVTKLTNKMKTEMLVYNYDTNKIPMQNLSGTSPVSLPSSPITQPELRFIRSYVNLHRKEVSLASLKSLVADLQKAITDRKVSSTSPYAQELNIIQENLVTLVNNTRGRGSVRIELNAKELNHLLSLITKRSGALSGTNKEAEVKVNSDASEVTSVPGVMTAAQLSKMNFKTLAFTGMWKGLFGEPGENFDLMIHGAPHMGKTSFLLKMAAYLANHFDKVMYISSEEYGSATLTKKVNELISPVPANLSFAGSLESIPFKQYRFFIIDSVNDLKLDLNAYKELRKSYRSACFILVLQHTKDGQFRGGKDWEHKVDIAAEIYEPGKIRVFRNRYSVYGNYDFMKEVQIKEEK